MKSALIFTLLSLMLNGYIYLNERGILGRYYNECSEFYDATGTYHKECDENLIDYRELNPKKLIN